MPPRVPNCLKHEQADMNTLNHEIRTHSDNKKSHLEDYLCHNTPWAGLKKKIMLQ